MKYAVSVKTKRQESKVEQIDPNHLIVSVKQPPIDGRANAGVIIALAKFFQTSPNRINIVSGHTSHNKVVEIM